MLCPDPKIIELSQASKNTPISITDLYETLLLCDKQFSAKEPIDELLDLLRGNLYVGQAKTLSNNIIHIQVFATAINKEDERFDM